MKEDWAIILDFLPKGYPTDIRRRPVAQALGYKFFSLLELVPKKEAKVSSGDKVYIGEGRREAIKFIKRRLQYDQLTSLAKNELENMVEDIVNKNKEKFVNFFNESEAITTRMHRLELLPGIGKKHLRQILDKRKEEKFKSFEDIDERVSLLPNPKKLIIRRIMEEIKNPDERHHIFVIPPKRKF